MASAFVASEVLVVTALIGPLVGLPWWQGFRAYAYPDQLTYASIATNWARGDMRFVEPFTQTGTSHYPSLWYQLMGLLARVSGLPVYTWWTLMGLVAVSAAVLACGWLALRMSGRAWAPILPALAIYTGVLAAETTGTWFVELLNHARLWGPLASFFALNSEVAGVCLVVIAMVLILATDPQNGGAYRPWLVVVAAAILGLTANVHTYAFFAGAILALAFAASLAISRSRSVPLMGTTIGLLIVALVLGPTVARNVGPLPVIALLLLAFTPAALTLARGNFRTATAVAVAYALCAAPQLVRTAIDLAQGDPFLTFRQLSSSGLGVAIPSGLLAALPLLLLGAVCVVALWGRRQHSKNALLVALTVGAILMSQNDRWGFNQEPYRFWIIFTTLSGLLMAPVLAWAFTQRARLEGHRQFALTALVAVGMVLWVFSLIDTAGFWHSARVQGVFSMEDGQAQATREVLAGKEGLVVTSACLEPQVLKVITGTQVAHYNRGLAWPDNVKELYRFLEPKDRAAEDPRQLQVANVRWVLTDSSCSEDWKFGGDDRVVQTAKSTYDTSHGHATITLWRVTPA